MKVGNRLKQGTRDQRIQDRHARLVAQVNQLKDDNAKLQKQVDSNKAAFDWARVQAHVTRLTVQNGDLKKHILDNDCGNGIDTNGNFTRVLTDNGSISLV
jgi:hypothetical protein